MMLENSRNEVLHWEIGTQNQDEILDVIRIKDGSRRAHFLSLLPSTISLQSDLVDGNVETSAFNRSSPVDYRIQVEASAFLAIQHLNSHSGHVLPNLPTLLESCDIQFTLEMRDTQFSPIEAIRQLLLALQENYTSPGTRLVHAPTAILGAGRSASSQVVSVMGGVYEIPEISSSSTSGALDNKDAAPYFARTIPTNAGDAKAIIAYFAMLHVSHFAVLYVNDDYGNYYAQALSDYATSSGFHIKLVSFEDSVDESIETSVVQLQQTGLRYFVGIFDAKTWRQVVRIAYRGGIMGQPGYTWLLSDSALEITQPGFQLSRSSDIDLAQAIHGSGVVSLSLSTYPPFDRELRKFYLNETLQKDFISSHPDYHVFDGYTFTFRGAANSASNSFLYQYLTYDAVIAMGLAACSKPQSLLNGPELYQTLLNVEFQGASGLVRFSNVTGTRFFGDVAYSIQNVLQDFNVTGNDEVIDFRSQTSAHIYPSCDRLSDNCSIQILEPFIYMDNTTIPPSQLPELQENLNLIPLAVRILGWAMCAIVIMVSVGWIAWTYQYRNKDVVRASQPIFLVILCIGCSVMALAIIPLSLQEPVSATVLDVGCMATPWFLSVGFVLTFSALFSKMWRLNKLFASGEAFRRVKLRPRDVTVPLAALTFVNVAVLTIWTALAPLVWVRVPVTSNVDSFGRYPDSFGSCFWNVNKDYRYVFLIAVSFVDAIALVFANYQSYLARNIPTDFSESSYVALSMAGLLEAYFLGAPIVVLVRDNPSAFFLVFSILISIICLVILLPVFVPKYMLRNLYQRRPRRRGRRASVAVSVMSSSSKASCGDGQLRDESSSSLAGSTKIFRSAEYFERRLSIGATEFGVQQQMTDQRRRSVAFGQVTVFDVPKPHPSSQGGSAGAGGPATSSADNDAVEPCLVGKPSL